MNLQSSVSRSPALPPGKIRVLFDKALDRLDKKLPLTYKVTLRYKDPTGKKEWEDPYPLDLRIYLGSRIQTFDERRQQRIESRRRTVRILRHQGLWALAWWLWDRALRRFGLH